MPDVTTLTAASPDEPERPDDQAGPSDPGGDWAEQQLRALGDEYRKTRTEQRRTELEPVVQLLTEIRDGVQQLTDAWRPVELAELESGAVRVEVPAAVGPWTAPAECAAPGPWDDYHECRLDAGHDGQHEAHDGCVWPDKPAAAADLAKAVVQRVIEVYADEHPAPADVPPTEHDGDSHAVGAWQRAYDRANEAEKRAEIAEKELRVLRAGLRANGADPTQIQNLWAQIRLRNRQWRGEKERAAQAQQRAEQAEAALTEAQQVTEIQKHLIGTERRIVMTAIGHREDMGVKGSHCRECSCDHMADLAEAIEAGDRAYAEAFPATADGPARPGQLPATDTPKGS